MSKIELDNGKYTVVNDLGAKGGKLHALRYGEEWRNLSGDGLVLAMYHEIERLERLENEAREHMTFTKQEYHKLQGEFMDLEEENERLRDAISWGVSCSECSNQLAENWELVDDAFKCSGCIEYGGDSE